MADATTLIAARGADAEADCRVDAGWFLSDAANATKGLSQCPKGTWKELLGNVACTTCAAGTTTSITEGATALSDCDACKPGFGGVIADLSAPTCTKCTSGFYSPGNVKGGANCTACPKPSLFTGKMVSRNGITTPEDCVGEFVTDGEKASFLPWDRIPDANTVASPTDERTNVSCQAACAADDRCQYFEFYNYNATADGPQCFLRRAAATIAKPTMVAGANTAAFVLFEVKEGQYAVYAAADFADALAIGTDIGSPRAFNLAKSDCDKDPACVGIANTATDVDSWRLFAGEKWEGVTGKVRVVGETINAWIAEPAA